MNNPNQRKSGGSWVTLIIVILIAGGIYFYFEGLAPGSGTLTTGPTTQDDTSQVVNLLNQIQGINLDTSIFKDPAYQTLRDFSVPIPDQTVGRSDPFAPIPGFTLTIPGTGGASTKH